MRRLDTAFNDILAVVEMMDIDSNNDKTYTTGSEKVAAAVALGVGHCRKVNLFFTVGSQGNNSRCRGAESEARSGGVSCVSVDD